MAATLSTHVLDTARGVPAEGVGITLFAVAAKERTHLAAAITNGDGRTDTPLSTTLAAGTYELVFEVAGYFAARETPAFFDEITVRFRIDEGAQRYHVPLLLSPWGYSTYRGS
jgi:5-hydroxyisourate hydrolase